MSKEATITATIAIAHVEEGRVDFPLSHQRHDERRPTVVEEEQSSTTEHQKDDPWQPHGAATTTRHHLAPREPWHHHETERLDDSPSTKTCHRRATPVSSGRLTASRTARSFCSTGSGVLPTRHFCIPFPCSSARFPRGSIPCFAYATAFLQTYNGQQRIDILHCR